MRNMHRHNITLDDETTKMLKLWKDAKGIPASALIRLAVQAYTRWKKAELAPTPSQFDGVDLPEGGERTISLDD
jgi:hypothetical protein